MPFLAPSETLTDRQRQSGLKALRFQTIGAAGADGLASGGFLAAFALILGASNLHIGIMTAIPFIMQPVQILAVVVVERFRRRKAIAVPAHLIAFAAWTPIALIPFLIDVPNAGAVTLLLVFVAVRGVATAFVNTSWTSWLRDIAAGDAMGGFFAQRLRTATITAAIAGLAAALYIDWWQGVVVESEVIFGYSYAILLGSILLGFGSVGMMARIPEPAMAPVAGVKPSAIRTLSAPLRDGNYAQLIRYLFLWNFVAFLAAPFFTVYMLTKLELSLLIVVALGVWSQLSNVFFLPVWGPLADRFGSKVILSICSSLYFLVIFGWTFTTMPDVHFLTMPLLILLHALIGIASAGINVASTTLRMKLAPTGQATAYLTAASLAANLGAGISPLLGGAFVDFFSVRHFEIIVEWVDPSRIVTFPAVFLTGYDFLFAIAFFLGLIVQGVLALVKEEGEVESDVVMSRLMNQTRENLRSLNVVPGLGTFAQFPIAGLRYLPRIPGLDVAASVTAYQLASSTREAIEAVARGPATARQVRTGVSRAIARAGRGSRQVARQGTTLAVGAAHGAVAVAYSAGVGSGRAIQAAVRETIEVVNDAGADPLDALRGAVIGAISGGTSTPLRSSAVARHAIRAARQSAPQLGLSPQEAASQAAQAAIEAAEQLDVESQAQVKEAALQELIEGPGSDAAIKS